MAEPLYNLDPNGTSEFNLIKNERHQIEKGRLVRLLAPKHGAFFTDSVIVRDNTTTLKEGEHYEFIELYDTLTLKYNKPIAGMILITDPELESVSIDYQVIGWEYNLPTDFIAKFVNDRDNKSLSKEDWIAAFTKSGFLPDPKVHDLGTEYGFEYICYGLEKIRQVVIRSDVIDLSYALELIEKFIKAIPEMINEVLAKNDVVLLIQYYIDSLNSALVGLDKVVNLPPATPIDGAHYGERTFQPLNDENKYIITSSLMTFKEELYKNFVLKDVTGLDLHRGIAIDPLVTRLTDMANGTRKILYPLEDYTGSEKRNNITPDTDVYPNPADTTSKWLIYKLTNGLVPVNTVSNVGVFLGINISTGELFTGLVKPVNNLKNTIIWKRIITDTYANQQIDLLSDHINDTNNPHKTQKFHIGLGDVENLPVVTKEDILCRKPIRKYVTYDALLYFWKVFLKDIPVNGEEEDPDAKIDVAERIRLIFAPCGPCGTEPTIDKKKLGSMQLRDDVEPRGRLVAAWCDRYTRMGRYTDGFGGTYETVLEEKSRDCMYTVPEELKERGTLLSSYCEGTTLYGRYADGTGGYYVAVIFEDSEKCGGNLAIHSEQLVPVRNSDGELLGYGYSPAVTPLDIDADTLLTNAHDEPVAYIYKQPKDNTVFGFSANIALKDDNNQVIGYLIPKDII